jgi:hypothetical protein
MALMKSHKSYQRAIRESSESHQRVQSHQRERGRMPRQVPDKFQPFLNFKAQSAFYEIAMKQKQNRNLMIETLKGGKHKKGNLTETVNVKKVT